MKSDFSEKSDFFPEEVINLILENLEKSDFSEKSDFFPGEVIT